MSTASTAYALVARSPHEDVRDTGVAEISTPPWPAASTWPVSGSTVVAPWLGAAVPLAPAVTPVPPEAAAVTGVLGWLAPPVPVVHWVGPCLSHAAGYGAVLARAL